VGISVKQFEALKSRLSSGKPSRTGDKPDGSSNSESRQERHSVILGIDPSMRGTGYGIVRFEKPHPVALAHGRVSCPSAWEHSRCLLQIFQTLRDVIKEHRPTVCAVEGLFFAQNLKTALIMGEARGAALAAVAEAGLDVYEHAPRRVKQAIVGYGAAQKLAVAKMVQRMLKMPDLPDADAADALAVALTHAQGASRFSLSPAKRC